MNKYFIWIIFFACTIVASSSSAVWTINGDWYQSLNEPSFRPPSWLFGPVWTTLYILISIAAYRLVTSVESTLKHYAIALWALQITLNTIWTPVFFGANALGIALIYIVVLWAAILALIIVSWRVDRISSLILIPYLLWVSFATLLNYSFWQLNPGA